METIRFVWRPGDGDLSDAYRVRLRVFCDEQGYRPDMELDEQDAASQHLIAYDGDEPVATGRLYEKAPAVYGLGRIPFYEKQGFAVCGGEHLDGHVPHRLMRRKL